MKANKEVRPEGPSFVKKETVKTRKKGRPEGPSYIKIICQSELLTYVFRY